MEEIKEEEEEEIELEYYESCANSDHQLVAVSEIKEEPMEHEICHTISGKPPEVNHKVGRYFGHAPSKAHLLTRHSLKKILKKKKKKKSKNRKIKKVGMFGLIESMCHHPDKSHSESINKLSTTKQGIISNSIESRTCQQKLSYPNDAIKINASKGNTINNSIKATNIPPGLNKTTDFDQSNASELETINIDVAKCPQGLKKRKAETTKKHEVNKLLKLINSKQYIPKTVSVNKTAITTDTAKCNEENKCVGSMAFIQSLNNPVCFSQTDTSKTIDRFAKLQDIAMKFTQRLNQTNSSIHTDTVALKTIKESAETVIYPQNSNQKNNSVQMDMTKPKINDENIKHMKCDINRITVTSPEISETNTDYGSMEAAKFLQGLNNTSYSLLTDTMEPKYFSKSKFTHTLSEHNYSVLTATTKPKTIKISCFVQTDTTQCQDSTATQTDITKPIIINEIAKTIKFPKILNRTNSFIPADKTVLKTTNESAKNVIFPQDSNQENRSIQTDMTEPKTNKENIKLMECPQEYININRIMVTEINETNSSVRVDSTECTSDYGCMETVKSPRELNNITYSILSDTMEHKLFSKSKYAHTFTEHNYSVLPNTTKPKTTEIKHFVRPNAAKCKASTAIQTNTNEPTTINESAKTVEFFQTLNRTNSSIQTDTTALKTINESAKTMKFPQSLNRANSSIHTDKTELKTTNESAESVQFPPRLHKATQTNTDNLNAINGSAEVLKCTQELSIDATKPHRLNNIDYFLVITTEMHKRSIKAIGLRELNIMEIYSAQEHTTNHNNLDIMKFLQEQSYQNCSVLIGKASDEQNPIPPEIIKPNSNKERLQAIKSLRKGDTSNYFVLAGTTKQLQRINRTMKLLVMKLRCYLCKITFKSNIHLLHHLESDHGVARMEVCKMCGNSFITEKDIQIHLTEKLRKIKNFTDAIKSRCFLCKMTFQTNILLHHLKCVHGKTFVTTKELEDHIAHDASCIITTPITCYLCRKTFESNGLLLDHLKCIHGVVKMEVCKTCGKSFVTEKELKDHRIIEHND